jgi:hypothetical protein
VLSIAVAAPLAALTVVITLATTGGAAPRSNTEQFQFPDDYVGAVYVQIPEHAGDVTIDLSWGDWKANWVIKADDPRSYWFSKGKAGPSDPNPPLAVTVTPGVDIVINYGQLPIGTRSPPSGAWHFVGSSGE